MRGNDDACRYLNPYLSSPSICLITKFSACQNIVVLLGLKIYGPFFYYYLDSVFPQIL